MPHPLVLVRLPSAGDFEGLVNVCKVDMGESEGEDDVGPFEVFGVMGGVTAPIRKLTAENRCEPQ